MLLFQIVDLLVRTAAYVLVGVCLMRLWLQMRRIPMHSAVGVFVMAMSDWIVKPLRRILPGFGGIDWASLVAAYLICLVAMLLISMAIVWSNGFFIMPRIEFIALHASFLLLGDALFLGMAVVFFVAALSWLNPFSPVLPILDALTAPLLRPIRRILPPIGRVDLSPMVLFMLIYLAKIILEQIEGRFPFA